MKPTYTMEDLDKMELIISLVADLNMRLEDVMTEGSDFVDWMNKAYDGTANKKAFDAYMLLNNASVALSDLIVEQRNLILENMREENKK